MNLDTAYEKSVIVSPNLEHKHFPRQFTSLCGWRLPGWPHIALGGTQYYKVPPTLSRSTLICSTCVIRGGRRATKVEHKPPSQGALCLREQETQSERQRERVLCLDS